MKRGFTLIELLVVIAVLGLLISITAPALSSAREAARNVSCKNNLRQIGIALNAYHGAHARFPIGCVEWRPPGNTSNRQLAWSAFILPFAESSSTHESVDFKAPFDSEKNSPAASTVISMFLCPSSLHTTRTESGRGRSEYGGIYGERITSPNNPPKGMMLFDKAVRLREVTDGTSKTLIVSEDTGWADGEWINGRNIFDQAFPINAAPSFENDIRSDHIAGANGLLVDGAVRFLADDTSLVVVAALCTRAGNEKTEEL